MVTTLTTCGVNESGALLKESMSIRPEAIGKIIMFAGNTAPEGTLYCNGAAISRTTYSELFAAIGTTWGSGDGTTTFNLPDLRDQWVLCAGTGHEAGDAVDEGLPDLYGALTFRPFATGTAQNPQYAPSVAVGTGGLFTQTLAPENPGQWNFAAEIGISSSDGEYLIGGDAIRFRAQNANSIYGAQTHVTPASVAVLPCIVYE